MLLMNEYLKPHASRHCRFPIPAELMVVLGGTLASHLLQLGPRHAVQLVGHIPLGIPTPELPPVSLVGSVAVDALAISLVSYSVTISMAMILSKKQNYRVRPNQELLAMGLSNLVGAMFSCIPNATSLSRSLIQEQTGGRTQLTSVVSAGLITAILLWIAPIFEVLPRCALSGIIVVALKGMYMQAGQLGRFHRESVLNSLTWVVTFAATVMVDVDVGLLAGLACSLVAIYAKGWRTTHCELGAVPGAPDLYADVRTHRAARAVPGVCIFRFAGPLNFATADTFKRALHSRTEVTYGALRRASQMGAASAGGMAPTEGDGEQQKLMPSLRTVVLDLSGVTHMDVAALKMVNECAAELRLLGVRLLLAAPNDGVHAAVMHAESLGVGEFEVMASVHDAVLYAQEIARVGGGAALAVQPVAPRATTSA